MIHFEISLKTKLKWKEPKKYKDEYRFPIVQIQESKDNLHLKMTPHHGASFPPMYITIDKYKEHTALEVLNLLALLGYHTRHANSAVLGFYYERDLDLGFLKKVLRPMFQKKS